MRKELLTLREIMEKRDVQWCVVPTDDYHASEYVGDYFKCRAYVSGFTGSAGTLLVGREWAGLWTDGRYFLQAEAQLRGSGISLMKSGEPGVPTLTAFLSENLKPGETLAFDGRTVSWQACQHYREIAREAEASLRIDLDLVGEIWEDRPALSAAPAFELPLHATGRSRADKLALVREAMRLENAGTLVLSSLMDICWLMNLRGGDVACTPVVLSYAVVTPEKAVLFLNPAVLSPEIREHLAEDGVEVAPYEAVEEEIRRITAGTTVWMDLKVVNCALRAAVPEGVAVLNKTNPTVLPKAVKNATEVANFREAHVKDGVAVTRLMYWLKKNIGTLPMDEISVAEKLESLRREQPGYLMPSFHPIIAWGPHGAIIHYSATEETNWAVQPRSFLLADTGGHYMEGTTDITRTFAMGPLTNEEKELYTRVLMGHLRLGAARFRHGCSGLSLDCLAHGPLWEIGMDYNHGTGHGVGYVLSVHEGPQSFRWWKPAGTEPAVLEPGMITSDEPGVYLEGKFGVRLENLTVVCEDQTNAFGRFLRLEYLTLVPFDLDAIVPEMLEERDRRCLNAYHALVQEKILPHLSDPEERAWLIRATRAI